MVAVGGEGLQLILKIAQNSYLKYSAIKNFFALCPFQYDDPAVISLYRLKYTPDFDLSQYSCFSSLTARKIAFLVLLGTSIPLFLCTNILKEKVNFKEKQTKSNS